MKGNGLFNYVETEAEIDANPEDKVCPNISNYYFKRMSNI
jgi:hypothetical protein